MSDITPGSSFTNGQQITATDLNNLVGNANIANAVIDNTHLKQTSVSDSIFNFSVIADANISDDDYFLIWSATDGAFRRIAKSKITSQSQLTTTNVVTSNLTSSTATIGNYFATIGGYNYFGRNFVLLDQPANSVSPTAVGTHAVHLSKLDNSAILAIHGGPNPVTLQVDDSITILPTTPTGEGLLKIYGLDSSSNPRGWNFLSRDTDALIQCYPSTTNTPVSSTRATYAIGAPGTGFGSDLGVNGDVLPGTHNTYHLGSTSLRWDNLWNDGTFNGSDENLKQDIEVLDEAEKRVAVKAKALLKKYRLKSAVAKKGDNARIHVGIIAQELQSAFESEGLDPFRYSMIGKDTWWEKEFEVDDKIGQRTELKTYDSAEKAPEGATEKTQMSVNYSELLAFIISAI
jgi:hypothetical protein